MQMNSNKRNDLIVADALYEEVKPEDTTCPTWVILLVVGAMAFLLGTYGQSLASGY